MSGPRNPTDKKNDKDKKDKTVASPEKAAEAGSYLTTPEAIQKLLQRQPKPQPQPKPLTKIQPGAANRAKAKLPPVGEYGDMPEASEPNPQNEYRSIAAQEKREGSEAAASQTSTNFANDMDNLLAQLQEMNSDTSSTSEKKDSDEYGSIAAQKAKEYGSIAAKEEKAKDSDQKAKEAMPRQQQYQPIPRLFHGNAPTGQPPTGATPPKQADTPTPGKGRDGK